MPHLDFSKDSNHEDIIELNTPPAIAPDNPELDVVESLLGGLGVYGLGWYWATIDMSPIFQKPLIEEDTDQDLNLFG